MDRRLWDLMPEAPNLGDGGNLELLFISGVLLCSLRQSVESFATLDVCSSAVKRICNPANASQSSVNPQEFVSSLQRQAAVGALVGWIASFFLDELVRCFYPGQVGTATTLVVVLFLSLRLGFGDGMARSQAKGGNMPIVFQMRSVLRHGLESATSTSIMAMSPMGNRRRGFTSTISRLLRKRALMFRMSLAVFQTFVPLALLMSSQQSVTGAHSYSLGGVMIGALVYPVLLRVSSAIPLSAILNLSILVSMGYTYLFTLSFVSTAIVGGVMKVLPSATDLRARELESYTSLSESKKTIPCTILTGYLGSGKTTMLNKLLGEFHGKRIAIIENEFGEVGVDDAMINIKNVGDAEIIQFNNGCLCCKVRGDLQKALHQIIDEAKAKVDYIVLETSGLADPSPITQTFFVDPKVKKEIKIDGIVTVVDAKHLPLQLKRKAPEAVEQIAFADRIVLNKIDCVSSTDIEELDTKIKGINPRAVIRHTSYCDVSADFVLNIGAFSLDAALQSFPKFLEGENEHYHEGAGVSSVGFEWYSDFHLGRLNRYLVNLLQTQGEDIYRFKGVLSIHRQDERYIFNGVHMVLDGKPDRPWLPYEERKSQLCFIGKNLDRDELRRGLSECEAQFYED